MLANFQDFARFAADGILNSLLAGIAIALLAWAMARFARKQGSGIRFIIWFVALIVIALLPWAGPVSTSSRLTASAHTAGAVTLPGSLAFYLFVIWMVGAGFGLARVAFSLYRLQRLRSTCMPVDLRQLDPSLRAIVAEACTHRRATLCTSDKVRVPAAVGYFRPMVVFPTWALSQIPTVELNAILLH
jgi:beta-lactamase regulating signal transducer with metallopeptidase domain